MAKDSTTLKTVHKTDMHPSGTIIGGRFILTQKNYGIPSEKANIRYEAQRPNDKVQSYIAHDTTTLRAVSIRLILLLFAGRGLCSFLPRCDPGILKKYVGTVILDLYTTEK